MSMVAGSRPFKLVPVLLAALAASAQHPSVPKIVVREFGEVSNQGGYIPGYPLEHFAPAYLGNGLIGIRPNPNPLTEAKTIAAGFVYSHPSGAFEMSSPAPYPLGTEIEVGGLSLLRNPDRVKVRSQTLDMSTAELTTLMSFAGGSGLELELQIVQFLSRSTPALLCQEIQVTASRDATVEIRPMILMDGVPGSVYRDSLPNKRVLTDIALGLRSDRGSRLGIALFIPPGDGVKRKQAGVFSLVLTSGAARRFRTIAAMVTSAYDPEPDLQAIRVASWGGMVGFDELRQRNRTAWQELWKSRVKVDGDEAAQVALDAAFFYLHSSTHPSMITGVPPFGTSQWSDYSGHVFWDMDHWIMPATLPADPSAARSMLAYRLRGLDAARKKAASFGFRGAMFPWEAGLDGSEVTPSEAATGWSEQHVVPEVALAFWEYHEATGDSLFLHEAVWPVVRDVAEWIASRGAFTDRGFEITNVMGHNEWVTNARNDSHVNLLCKMALRAAVRCARAVSVDPPTEWEKIERAIYVPIDEERDVVLPFSIDTPVKHYNEPLDRYEETTVGEQSNAYTLNNTQMLFFHDPPISSDLYRNTWAYEEQIRARRNADPSVPASIRSPGFTIPPLASVAAFFGDRRKAAELIRVAVKEYMVDPYLINKEYRPYKDGNYLMNQASLLMAAMFGFTGLRISEGDWRRYPASLPEGWARIEIDRFWIRGKPYRVVAEHGKTALLQLTN